MQLAAGVIFAILRCTIYKNAINSVSLFFNGALVKKSVNIHYFYVVEPL